MPVNIGFLFSDLVQCLPHKNQAQIINHCIQRKLYSDPEKPKAHQNILQGYQLSDKLHNLSRHIPYQVNFVSMVLLENVDNVYNIQFSLVHL